MNGYRQDQAMDAGEAQLREQAMAQMVQGSKDHQRTPINDAISQLRGLAESARGMRARLRENADRLFGQQDPDAPEMASADQALDKPPLFDELLAAVQCLDQDMNALANAVDRNCWAA